MSTFATTGIKLKSGEVSVTVYLPVSFPVIASCKGPNESSRIDRGSLLSRCACSTADRKSEIQGAWVCGCANACPLQPKVHEVIWSDSWWERNLKETHFFLWQVLPFHTFSPGQQNAQRLHWKRLGARKRWWLWRVDATDQNEVDFSWFFPLETRPVYAPRKGGQMWQDLIENFMSKAMYTRGYRYEKAP